MLVIRFLRVGKRNQPSFYIVVTEKERAPKSGSFIEKVGFYNPLTKECGIKAERVKYWLSVGAKPSDTVWNLLVSKGIIKGKKIPVHPKLKSSESKITKKEGQEEASEAESKEGKETKEETSPKETD